MNLYGPCTAEGIELTIWLKNIDIPDDEDWIILGDFNLYRYPKNRNREGANLNDMFLFNSTISHMVLSDIPLQSKKYTWSNMQQPPLLEKLDGVFTNNCWTLTYPETICKAFVMRSLITVPWLFPSHLLFPRLIFSDLKIIGCSGMTFKRFYLKTGMLHLKLQIRLKS